MSDILKNPVLAQELAPHQRAGRSISNSPILLLPAAAVAAVAWLVPIDILDRLPWIRVAANQLGIDDRINRLAAVSAFSQVSFATYLMMGLLLLPPSLWAAFRMFRWRSVPPPDGPRFRVSTALGMATVAFALVGGAVFALFWLPGDPGFCEGCTTQSRLGLGVVLGCVTYAIPLLTGLGFWRLFAVLEHSGKIKR